MKPASHILVIRLSSAGDVALTVPVLYSFKKKFPETKLTILTRKNFKDLFSGLDAEVFIADTKGIHNGIFGLIRLFFELKKDRHFSAIADLHNVFRSQVLRFLFKLFGVPSAKIDKGRVDKKALTRKTDKELKALPSMMQRYQKVFADLGYSFDLDFEGIFQHKNAEVDSFPENEKGQNFIGIAPFAKFEQKVYPKELMKKVIALLLVNPMNKIYFFGGGKIEKEELDQWVSEFPGTTNMTGLLSLRKELEMMSNLDVMICMDSANMHFAALANAPVISIWGATHPFAGFSGWNTKPKNQIQIDLECRPCSVFGNKVCYRGDFACMHLIAPEIIVNKVNEIIGEKSLKS